MRKLGLSLSLTSAAMAVRSAFKIANVNPVLWWDAESHRAGLAGGAATLFQDAAGTSAVSAVEQPVGRAVDQSGNARHALQATSTARPVLTARKNLLTYSERFDNAAWSKSNDALPASTVHAGTATAPDGSNSACRFSPGISGNAPSHRSIHGNRLFFEMVGSNGAFTNSVYIKTDVVDSEFTIFVVNAGSDAVVASVSATSSTTWQRIAVSGITNGVTAGIRYVIATKYPVLIWGAQLEKGPTATSYQRVTTATDYDTTAAPLMLQFDGVDDSLSTATFAAGTLPANADVYVVINRTAGDGASVVLGNGASKYIGVADSTVTPGDPLSAGAGTPTQWVNGVQVTTRVQTDTALGTSKTALFSAHGADISGWTGMTIGNGYYAGSGYGFTGGIGAVLITPAQPDSTRARIRKALAKAYQITGVV